MNARVEVQVERDEQMRAHLASSELEVAQRHLDRWTDEEFEVDLGSGGEVPARLHAGGVAGKVEHLFETIRNPKTGEPYTNAEVGWDRRWTTPSRRALSPLSRVR